MLRAVSGLTSAQVAARLHPGYPAGSQGWMAESTSANVAMAAVDTVYLYPFRVYSRIVVNLIGVRASAGGAGSAIKCAVWANNYITARPTGLPVLGQNAGFDTTGSGNDTAAIANVALNPGIYWGGTKTTGTPPTMLSIGNAFMPIYNTGITSATSFFTVADAYANDIMALDMTGATFGVIGSSAACPALSLGWV